PRQLLFTDFHLLAGKGLEAGLAAGFRQPILREGLLLSFFVRGGLPVSDNRDWLQDQPLFEKVVGFQATINRRFGALKRVTRQHGDRNDDGAKKSDAWI